MGFNAKYSLEREKKLNGQRQVLSVQFCVKIYFFSKRSVWYNFGSSANVQDSSELSENSVKGKEKLGHRLQVECRPVT